MMRRQFELFQEALERSPEQRAGFVAAAARGDSELAARVLQLLAAHESAEASERLAKASAGPTEAGEDREPGRPPAQEGVAIPAAADPVPEQIGPYRVLERIGEGGMGIVYRAEQREPLRRQVAIKVVKLGMDTREVLARFEAERQTLAVLDHPGVAKVFDAGVSESGRPYFVMELVQGLPLIAYCREHGLSLAERLRLFVTICSAVQHAHHKGVIHRDLKPTNILVATHEGQPVPKVIDFGVAKATASGLSNRTAFTERGQLIGTPEYMSPEQATASLDIDTRTDVYSLGVILYQMVCAELPFDPERLRRGGYSEVARVIGEEQPPPPSSRLAARERDASAPNRGSTTTAKQVRGELDWIVLRAMEKDRTRRYESAAALREDVARYLDDRTVLARPPSLAYTLRKLVRRHRVATALVAVVLVSALVGIAGLSVGLVRARTAEGLAQRRAENALATSEFLKTLFYQADPEYGGGNPTLYEAMDSADPMLSRGLADHPEVEASVREMLGVAFRRRSMFGKAAPHLWTSLELRRRVLGHGDLKTASSQVALAALRVEYEGNLTAGRELLHRAGNIFGQHGLEKSVARAWLDLDIGLVEWMADELADAESMLAACERRLSEDRGRSHPDVSRPLRARALVALADGKIDQAERLAARAAGVAAGGLPYLSGRARFVQATVLVARGAHAQASDRLDAVREQFVKIVGEHHIRIAECDELRARLELARGELGAAELAADRCHSLRTKLLQASHWQRAVARQLQLQVAMQRGRGDYASTDAALAEIESTIGRQLGTDHRLTVDVIRVRADCAEAHGERAASDAQRRRHAQAVQHRGFRLAQARGR